MRRKVCVWCGVCICKNSKKCILPPRTPAMWSESFIEAVDSRQRAMHIIPLSSPLINSDISYAILEQPRSLRPESSILSSSDGSIFDSSSLEQRGAAAEPGQIRLEPAIMMTVDSSSDSPRAGDSSPYPLRAGNPSPDITKTDSPSRDPARTRNVAESKAAHKEAASSTENSRRKRKRYRTHPPSESPLKRRKHSWATLNLRQHNVKAEKTSAQDIEARLELSRDTHAEAQFPYIFCDIVDTTLEHSQGSDKENANSYEHMPPSSVSIEYKLEGSIPSKIFRLLSASWFHCADTARTVHHRFFQ